MGGMGDVGPLGCLKRKEYVKFVCKAKDDLFDGFTIGKEYSVTFTWAFFVDTSYEIENDFGEIVFFTEDELRMKFEPKL